MYNNISVKTYVDDQAILTPGELPETLFLLGEGVRDFDLWQLENIQMEFLDGHAPSGITKFNYNSKSVVGDQLHIKGRYQQGKQGHRLVLTDPGGKALDSIVLGETAVQDFELKTILPLKGKFLYEIQEKDSLGERIRQDPLPVVIANRNRLRIAIINEFPTFETKYLKNFLAEKGHEVLVRSQLTTDRFKYEYFNMEQRSGFRFAEDVLATIDLLIIDVNSLKGLPRNTRTILENSIRKNGLGLYIQSDEDVYTKTLPIADFSFSRKQHTTIQLNQWPKTKWSTYPFSFVPSFSLIPIHQTGTDIVAAYERKGVGRIGATVFQNTYELVLNGQTDSYQNIWTQLLKTLSKKEQPNVVWQTPEFPIYDNEPFTFQLRTREVDPIVTTTDKGSIPLKGDVDIANLWKGITHPQGVGWKGIQLAQDTTRTLSYYVTDDDHWSGVTTTKTRAINERYFKEQNIQEGQIKKVFKPISPLWFVLLFLGSIGWLWLEPKL